MGKNKMSKNQRNKMSGSHSKKQKPSAESDRQSRRKLMRHQTKQERDRAWKRSTPIGKAEKWQHAGAEALDRAKDRMRGKVLERKFQKFGKTAPLHEKVEMLRELGLLHFQQGKARFAANEFQQLVDLQPKDPSFARLHLLCSLTFSANTEQASVVLKGPLFQPLLAAAGVSAEPPAASKKRKKGAGEEAPAAASAATDLPATLLDMTQSVVRQSVLAGVYTLALLLYISCRVLEEHSDNPAKGAKAEERLVKVLRAAKKQNPFAAEVVAFAAIFEKHFFEEGEETELPDEKDVQAPELPLLDALQYCFVLKQASVWMDTDAHVRNFIRSTLFEEDDEGKGVEEPSFGELHEPREGGEDLPLVAKWRAAREEALEKWAVEGSDEEGEEEDGESDEEEESEEEMTGMDMNDLKKRMLMG